MIRIVGVQRCAESKGEFVLLQNQGAMRLVLRGHVLMAEEAFDHSPSHAVHVFVDEVKIGPGQFVLLRSCSGEPHWSTTKEGHHVYHTFANSDRPIWSATQGTLHLLGVQHTFTERREPALMV